MPRTWDVFCRVIDNYGDAAVCWRIAQQLSAEHGGRVRLWIDALAPLHALCPEISVDAARQTVAGVEVCRWDASAACGKPADIVVDAFGAGLPGDYVTAMAGRAPRSLWIILEYLSAEAWVGAHHRMPSPHPRLPLERHFFFPGLVPGTGGVLREAGYTRRRAAFEADASARSGFWRASGFAPPDRQATVVSLFGYANPATAALLQAWADGETPVLAAVTTSALRGAVGELFGKAALDGQTLKRGCLEVRFLPFMPQARYDELLWACDWNFVRGEDSFVRAQLAGRPLVWQIYPQAERAHEAKLEAFMDLYCAGLERGLGEAFRRVWRAWNGSGGAAGVPGQAWSALAAQSGALRANAGDWERRLAEPGELVSNLAQFCEDRLK